MKQYQYDVSNFNKFKEETQELKNLAMENPGYKLVFQIFVFSFVEKEVKDLCKYIEDEFPEAGYFGCSTNGNIYNGCVSSNNILVTCTIFEDSSSVYDIAQYSFNQENIGEVATCIKRDIENRPWIKSVELLFANRDLTVTDFCRTLQEIPQDICVFGGGAFAEKRSLPTIVFSKGNGFCTSGVVFLWTGGENLHTYTEYFTGWKPLGVEMMITKADRAILYEINNEPAFDIYSRYLDIKNDENFFYNTLEFPILYRNNGIDVLRAPTEVYPDGSILMSADVDSGVKARLSYGDPETILDNVRWGARRVNKFGPEVIKVYSCAARKAFWGESEISRETKPFNSICPTSGFYTSGEYLRTNGFINRHSVTLVISATREGAAKNTNKFNENYPMAELPRKVSIINRFATFIEASTDELRKANEKLEKMAITDGMTELYNRMEIQRRINEAIEMYNSKENALKNIDSVSLIMLDIDNFKNVNDEYGHHEGDLVIKGLSKLLIDVMEKSRGKISVGRWGGEEFMILLTDISLKDTLSIAEGLRKDFSEKKFKESGGHTMSLGVSIVKPGECGDCLAHRVDEALYMAKDQGKNKVVYKE
ncbi:MAG: diguanylate cyclase [Eubacterium sp.]|nr:diguanylate cyclase [Eubacterium sp.]